MIATLPEFLRPGGTVRNFCTDDGVCNPSQSFERPAAGVCDPLS
jgi:hypothetical protein